jgi:phosphoribosylglycinamide formyltransferase-1
VETRIAAFASGRGSNLEAILNNIQKGNLRNARIVLVISNNSKSGSMELAQRRGIETVHLSSKTHPDPTEYKETLLKYLTSRDIELILLAGYMKLLPLAVVRAFPNRILNIHPALLPRHGGKGMYGLAVHGSVIEAGEKESGVTIHYVNERYDEGAVIQQRKVPVLPDDTPESLAARVLEVEHDLYWRVVDSIINSAEARREGI